MKMNTAKETSSKKICISKENGLLLGPIIHRLISQSNATRRYKTLVWDIFFLSLCITLLSTTATIKRADWKTSRIK